MIFYNFILCLAVALLQKTSSTALRTTATTTVMSTADDQNATTLSTTTTTADFLRVNCSSTIQELFRNKNNNQATMTEVCHDCKIPNANCHCLKYPGLCKAVRTYNDNYWTNCQERMIRAITNFAFGIVGVIGNVLVVVVTLKFYTTLSRCHLLIGGLAVSDLIFSICQTVRYIPYFWTCQWRFGEKVCTGFPMIKELSSYLSVGFILIIATERFSLIVCPHRNPFSNTAIVSMCVINVILGAVACLPKVTHMRLDPVTGRCYADWGSRIELRLTYDYTLLAIYFFLPLFVIASEHAQIVRRRRHQQRTISKANIGDRNLQRNQRITRVLLVIIIGYVLLIFPKRFVCTLKAHNIASIMQSRSIVTTLRLVSCLPYGFHVALNPIIYSFFDRRFRKQVRIILPCRLGGLQPKFEKSSTNTSSSY